MAPVTDDVIQEYYTTPAVRARMIENLGGTSLEDASAVFITHTGGRVKGYAQVHRPQDLDSFLNQGLDISRSLWDWRSLVIDLDIEYVNFDFQAEPYLDMKRSYRLQQPVIDAVYQLFDRYNLKPLHFLTGRGHHFEWRIERSSPVYRKLIEVSYPLSYLETLYSVAQPPADTPVGFDLARAFTGAGLVMEYAAYEIKRKIFHEKTIPVQLTDVAVGPISMGREIVSIDISEYGDPLYDRMVRIPFSVYMKQWDKNLVHAGIADRIPTILVIPKDDLEIDEAIATMTDPEKMAELACHVSTAVPEQSGSMAGIIDAYLASSVREFHDWYFSQEHDHPHQWPQTYDKTPLDMFPVCIRHIVEHPNDLLLQPAGIQMLVRSMLALGWHPRHIAGFIRSKYERDFGWGDLWYRYSAAMRADFYVRIFSGLIIEKLDDLIDYNCLSTKEKQLCCQGSNHCDMTSLRNSLLERRSRGKLACRPFNRLFL